MPLIPRGVQFIPLGSPAIKDLARIASDLASTKCAHVEAHLSDGSVINSPAEELSGLIGRIGDKQAQLIGLSEHDNQRVTGLKPRNVYCQILADAEAGRVDTNYKKCFLTPSDLKALLLEGRANELSCPHFIHRQEEIQAVMGAAASAHIHSTMSALAHSIRRYDESGNRNVMLPSVSVYTTNPEYLRAADEATEIHVLPCPTAHLDFDENSLIDEERLSPPAKTGQCSQFDEPFALRMCD